MKPARIKELEDKYCIDLMVANKDRHSEVALLIESLRKQTFRNWNLIIGDESATPLWNCHFLTCLINRVKLEGHKVRVIRNIPSYGVCNIRNKLIEEQMFWKTGSNLVMRCDDDVILDPDYLEKLIEVIESGYDMASGIVPVVINPEIKREIRFIQPVINKHELDKEGNIIKNNDDCGYSYIEEEILPTHQFRTNCLYKSEIHKNENVRYPKNLTTVGFREEGFFSFKAIIEGFTIGVHTGAKAFHLITPSGGVRRDDYPACVQLDDESFHKWVKEKVQQKGNFIEQYNERLRERGLLK